MDLKTEISFCLLFHKTEKLMNDFFNQQLTELGLLLRSEHWHIIATLFNRGKLTQQEIADLHDKDKTNMTRIVDFLERNKWVKRLSCKTDRRNKFVKLTEEGKNLYINNEGKIKTAVISTIEKHFTMEEIVLLHSGISKLYEKLFEIIKEN